MNQLAMGGSGGEPRLLDQRGVRRRPRFALETAESLRAGSIDARYGGGGELRPRPAVDVPGQGGVPRLVSRDALHDRADAGVSSGLSLPEADQRAKRLANAACHARGGMPALAAAEIARLPTQCGTGSRQGYRFQRPNRHRGGWRR